jgi:hypothetical protein
MFKVSSMSQIIEVIIPHFERYPLITQKLADYLIFKKIVDKIRLKEHLTKEGVREIVGLKANLNKGLSDELKAAFPDITPYSRNDISSSIPDPN